MVFPEAEVVEDVEVVVCSWLRLDFAPWVWDRQTDDVGFGVVRCGRGGGPEFQVERKDTEYSEKTIEDPEEYAGPEEDVVFAVEDFDVTRY